MPKYFLYARKSTESEERQQLSIPAQLDELRDFAKKNSLQVIDTLIESKTAKEPGRKIFNDMIHRIQAGEADGILTWHADRLARNAVDAGQIIHLLDTGKLVDLKFPTMDFQNNPNGKFMLQINFGTSKYYIDNLAVNSKRGMLAKARRGRYPTLAPIGYKNDRLNKTILVDKQTASAITKAFRLYADGQQTLRSIARFLFTKGIKTKPTKKGPGNQPLRLETISYILKNPFYYGTFKYAGEYYPGKHKALITKKLFDEVQVVLSKKCWSCQPEQSNQKRPYNRFLFSGLIKCAECGYHITAENKTKHPTF